MTGNRKPLRLALIGWGAISRRIAALLAERDSRPAIAIVAVGVRNPASALDIPAGSRLVTNPQDFATLDLDLVVEAAGREAVGIWGEAALGHAPAFAVASTSAFCDDALLDRLDVARTETALPLARKACVDVLNGEPMTGTDPAETPDGDAGAWPEHLGQQDLSNITDFAGARVTAIKNALTGEQFVTRLQRQGLSEAQAQEVRTVVTGEVDRLEKQAQQIADATERTARTAASTTGWAWLLAAGLTLGASVMGAHSAATSRMARRRSRPPYSVGAASARALVIAAVH